LRTKIDCYNFGGNWQNSKLNFDNIFESIISLVFIAFGGGYIEIMENAADSKQIDYEPKSINQEPQQIKNKYLYFLFICYVLFISTFIMNIFILKVIRTFEKEKNNLDQNFLLTNF
jgi:fucose permease